MLKDLIRSLDYSDFAEVALAVFVIAFIAIVIGTMRLSRSATDRYSSIPLDDHDVKDPRQK